VAIARRCLGGATHQRRRFCDPRVRPDRRADIGVRREHFKLALHIGPNTTHDPHDPPAFPRVRVGADIHPQFKGAAPPLTDRTLHLSRPDEPFSQRRMHDGKTEFGLATLTFTRWKFLSIWSSRVFKLRFCPPSFHYVHRIWPCSRGVHYPRERPFRIRLPALLNSEDVELEYTSYLLQLWHVRNDRQCLDHL